MTIAVAVERLPFDVLHDEIGQAIFSCASVEQTADVWMIECGKYLSLFAEAAQDKVGVHPAFDQFYCCSFAELIIGAGCFVDCSHTTASNFTLDSIRAKTAPDHRI